MQSTTGLGARSDEVLQGCPAQLVHEASPAARRLLRGRILLPDELA